MSIFRQSGRKCLILVILSRTNECIGFPLLCILCPLLFTLSSLLFGLIQCVYFIKLFSLNSIEKQCRLLHQELYCSRIRPLRMLSVVFVNNQSMTSTHCLSYLTPTHCMDVTSETGLTSPAALKKKLFEQVSYSMKHVL